MAPWPPSPLFSQIPKKGFFNDEVLLKDILSLTLTLGWKNEKQPSCPIELDLEAGNLVCSVLSSFVITLCTSAYSLYYLQKGKTWN